MAHQHDDYAHHDHGHDHGVGNAGALGLIFVLILTLAFIVFEVFMFFSSNSLALLAHASHMLRDVAVIIMALFALWLSRRGPTASYTYGMRRADVLAAMVNALSLWLIAGFIFYNAFSRIYSELGEHHHEEVQGLTVLIVGGVGLIVNLVSAWVMHRSAGENVNLQGVFQHVIVDMMTTFGIILDGIVLIFFDWDAADDYITLVIGVLILLSSWRLVTRVLRVLMESTPENIDVYRLCSDIEDIEGVTIIHDIHVWTIAPGYESCTAHIIIDPSLEKPETQALQERIRELVRDRFQIEHITVQMDTPPMSCIEEDHLDHLQGRTREEVERARA